MSDAMDKMLRWSRRLSFVPRWVVVPTIHKQNVAEHTFHVVQLCRWLLERHDSYGDKEFALEVIEEALEHDQNEAAEGDIPSPRKGKKPVESLTQLGVILKCADLLEALCFLQEEKNFGSNHWVQPIWDDIFAKLHDVWLMFKYRDGHKPITSDLVRAVLAEVNGTYNDRHPAIEESNGFEHYLYNHPGLRVKQNHGKEGVNE